MSEIVKISDAVALGIHAATILAANKNKSLTTKVLAKNLEISETHLAKVMRRLSRAGYVTAARGPKGGFVLAKPAEKINFLQIYEAIDGPLSVPGCLIGKPKCNGRECVMGGLLHELYEKTYEYFQNTSLQDLTKVLKQ